MTILPKRLPDQFKSGFGTTFLSPSRICGRQYAGIALRKWFSEAPLIERTQDGMTLQRYAVARTTSVGKTNPIEWLEEPPSPEATPAVIVFRDQSAIVLERAPVFGSCESYDCFSALPIVFRFGGSFHAPSDPRKITMKARGFGKQGTLVSLSRDDTPGSWVNLKAGPTTILEGLDCDLRDDVHAGILREAKGWIEAARALPCLVDAPAGWPITGRLPDEDQLAEIGLGGAGLAGKAYMHPAFLPYRGFTKDQEETVSDFLRDLTTWAISEAEAREPGVAVNATAQIVAGVPRQDGSATDPTLKIWFENGRSKAETTELDSILDQARKIAKSDLSPAAWAGWVGQDEQTYRNRQAWLDGYTSPTRFTSVKQLHEMSAHQRIALRRKFGAVA